MKAQRSAEGAQVALDAFSDSSVITPAPSERKGSSIDAQHTTAQATRGEDIKFLREAVHIHKEKSTKSAHDYRSLLRPIQKMLAPKKGRGPAVCACGHARGKNVDVHLIERGNGTQRASVSVIYRCGNGEACPLCARHVAALRAMR